MRHQLVALGRCQLALERSDLFFQAAHLVEHRPHPGWQLGGRDLEVAGHAADGGFELLQISQRVVAGHGLDAADASSHASLGDDLEQTDVTGAAHMRATAQLFARAYRQHPHCLAVFFAKQHHRAAVLRVSQRHHLGRGRCIGQHLGVDDGLDTADLRIADRRVVGEVETGAIGVDQRAFLLHMVAQHLAQRLVHQVRGAVVAHRAGTLLGVDASGQVVADRDHALHHPALVAKHIRLDLAGVLDQHARCGAAQFARVTGLAAALGVKRALVEHDHAVVAGLDAGHGRAVDIERGDLGRLAGQVFIAVESGRRAVVMQPGGHLELGRRAGHRALAVHRRIKAHAIDRDTALAADIARQVDRKAEGVVQLECGVAVDYLRAAGERGFQDLHAVVDGQKEALLLGLEHLGDASRGAAQFGKRLAHLGIERRHQPVEERLARAQLVAMPDRAAGDAAQHIATALVARDHAVGHRESTGADVVGDHLERRRCRVAIACTGRVNGLFGSRQQLREQIDLVVAVHMLQHGCQPLQAHAGVHTRLGQRVHHAVLGAVELHEDVVPDLDVAVAVLAGRPRRAAGDLGAVVVEDLGARPARPRVAHHPEVV